MDEEKMTNESIVLVSKHLLLEHVAQNIEKTLIASMSETIALSFVWQLYEANNFT